MDKDHSLIALPADFAEMRRGQIEAHGLMTMDILIAQGVCTGCGEPLAGLELGTSMACGFRSVEELVRSAAEFAASVGLQAKTAPCHACGGPTRIAWVQYHAFHSGFGEDLVVHWEPEEGPLLLRWNPSGGMLPAGELTADEESRFVQDAAYREAWASFEIGDAENGVALVEDLFRAYPGDPLLLRFIPPLLANGYTKLGQAITDHHRRVAPGDPEGYYWAGEVLLLRINQRLEPSRRLPEARRAFEEALVHFKKGECLRPRDPHYPVGVARALVRLGRKQEARQALERAKALTRVHPHFAELEAALA